MPRTQTSPTDDEREVTAMKRFYESEIEVMLGTVCGHHIFKADEEIESLVRIRDQYIEGSQQYKILTNQITEIWNSARTGKCGFIGSHYNCAFSVMYLVFGIDVIGFLFDRPWIPFVEIDRFDPAQFLQRLSTLERHFETLKQGDELPISLSEREASLWSATVHGRFNFSDELHGFFLRQGFKELRDFAEAAKDLIHNNEAAKSLPSAENEDEPVADVFIHLPFAYGNGNADRLAYADYQRRFGPIHMPTLVQ
jgi:hypothetical protein